MPDDITEKKGGNDDMIVDAAKKTEASDVIKEIGLRNWQRSIEGINVSLSLIR